MLSYMLPVEDKPPPAPTTNSKTRMQLQLDETTTNLSNGRTNSPINSKETSISSFVSTVSHSSSMTPTSTSTDKGGKQKLIINGGKHQTLKRVSFGSSKGSMVETLIFESPVQEEPEPSPIVENIPFPNDQEQTEAEREKVRVKFFQQSKPQEVDLPDEPVLFTDTDYMMAATINDSNHLVYNRMESTDSGWENPFRPGGDLSREADEIVELIKGGKPITPTSGIDGTDGKGIESSIIKNQKSNLNATPNSNNSVNGNVKNEKKQQSGGDGGGGGGGGIDIKRGTVKPDGDGTQIEHVTIKKKSKCKCCVIQ